MCLAEPYARTDKQAGKALPHEVRLFVQMAEPGLSGPRLTSGGRILKYLPDSSRAPHPRHAFAP